MVDHKQAEFITAGTDFEPLEKAIKMVWQH
jgi:hypothetical protein